MRSCSGAGAAAGSAAVPVAGRGRTSTVCRPSASCRVPQAWPAARPGQAAAVRGGPPVAPARLGQVQLQRTRAAVGDGHGDLVVVGRDGQVERGAGVQHGVLAQLAGQQHHVVDERPARRPRLGRRPRTSASMSWIIRRTRLIDCMSGGNRIRRSSLNGHACSLLQSFRWCPKQAGPPGRRPRHPRQVEAVMTATRPTRTAVRADPETTAVVPTTLPAGRSRRGRGPAGRAGRGAARRCGAATSRSGCPAATGPAGEVVGRVQRGRRRCRSGSNRDLLRISRVVGREGRLTERLDEEGLRRRLGGRRAARSTR